MADNKKQAFNILHYQSLTSVSIIIINIHSGDGTDDKDTNTHSWVTHLFE